MFRTASLGACALAFSAVLSFPFLASGCRAAHEHDHGAHKDAPETARGAVMGNPHAGYCPVMGDKVDLAKARSDPKLYSDYKGKRYYFCCKDCKPDFDKEPKKYIASPAKPAEGHGSHSH